MISRKTLLRNVAAFFVSAKELKERGFKFFKLLVFRRFVGDQTQISTRSYKRQQWVTQPMKAVETFIHGQPNVKDIVLFILLILALDSKGIINTLKKY